MRQTSPCRCPAMALPSGSSRIAREIACGFPVGWFVCLVVLFLSFLLSSCSAITSASPADPPAVIVAVTPASAIVAINGAAQFTVTVQNATDAAIQWEVNNVPGGTAAMGTITSMGTYQAPATVPGSNVQVTAVLQADTSRFGSANVTVVPPVSVSPRQVAVTTSETIQFQATVPAGAGAVNWSSTGGSVNAGGLYTPPPGAGTFTVTATSQSDSTSRASATVYVTDFAGDTSWRNDAGLTGQNQHELALSPATLGAGLFAKLASCPVDGQIYAQPLYVANLAINGQAHNVVYVVTEHDSVYAFDADAVPCQQVWMTSFLNDVLGITPVPSTDVPGADITPEIGITGTPVIDRASGTLYLVARTEESTIFGQNYFQRLHALDIVTGSEKFLGPVAIVASAPCGPRISAPNILCGDGNDGTDHIPFDPLLENQRAGLQLVNGKVYVAFAGPDTTNGFHGWLLAYSAATLAQVDAFNSTPNTYGGGIVAAPSADSAGNIYVATGYGRFDSALALLSRKDFAQSVLELLPPPPSFSIANASTDTFTPFNQSVLTANQNDLGATGILVLPDQVGAANPRMAVVGGTQSVLYLLNRDNLGGFTLGGPDQVLKTLKLNGGIYGTPAYWQSMIYTAAAGDALKAFSLAGGTLAGAPSSQSGVAFGSQGASPAVSSNGASGGIVWVVDTSGLDAASSAPAVLHAYDATNLARELYNSSAKAADAAGPAVPLAVPTVANGKVYVGTQNELSVYGLVP